MKLGNKKVFPLQKKRCLSNAFIADIEKGRE